MNSIQLTKGMDKLSFLRKEIESTFGRPILNYGDCLALSEAIASKTANHINVNTLRRFFGLVSYKGSPSRTTLNILAAFCGFSSFDQVTKAQKNGSALTLEEGVVQYFSALFRAGTLDEMSAAYTIAVENALCFLHDNVQLMRPVMSEMVETAGSRSLFFQRFINIDRLNGYYGNGLIEMLAKETMSSEQVLAHALLVFRYWLSDDEVKLVYHYQQLSRLENVVVHDSTIKAWYFAAQVFYGSVKKVRPATGQDLMWHWLEKDVTEAGFQKGRLQFALVCGQALALTGRYTEASRYLGVASGLLQTQEQPDNTYLLQRLWLWEAFVLVFTGKKDRLSFLLQKLDPAKFHFLTRRYESILYHFINYVHLQFSEENQSLCNWYINDTGFRKLAALPAQYFKLNNI